MTASATAMRAPRRQAGNGSHPGARLTRSVVPVNSVETPHRPSSSVSVVSVVGKSIVRPHLAHRATPTGFSSLHDGQRIGFSFTSLLMPITLQARPYLGGTPRQDVNTNRRSSLGLLRQSVIGMVRCCPRASMIAAETNVPISDFADEPRTLLQTREPYLLTSEGRRQQSTTGVLQRGPDTRIR